jgi:hypothetical protein
VKHAITTLAVVLWVGAIAQSTQRFRWDWHHAQELGLDQTESGDDSLTPLLNA